jgi:MarR family transcriptional regulator for hemolysin
MRLRKASDLGFQERRISNFVSPSIGEVTEAGSLSGEQSRREGVLGRRGEGIAMGARKAGEISPHGDKARHGVLPGVYPVIAWLMQLPESTQAELSRLIGIEQPTMAITLRRMERDGLIQRKPDPDHGRRSHVTLSARGRKLSQVMRTAAHEVEKLATDGLSAAEVDQFFRLAGIMIQNLNIERYGRK